jgi:hypothetical protein
MLWYYYFSWWIFIWFLLYKMKVIKYSPFLIYLFASIYVLIKLFVNTYRYFMNNYTLSFNNVKVLLLLFFIIFVIDFLPFIVLKKDVNTESTIFTLVLLILYLMFVQYNNKSVIDIYTQLNIKSLLKIKNTKELLYKMFVNKI